MGARALDETPAESHARTRAFTRPLRWTRKPGDIHLPTLGFKVDGEVVAATVPPPELGAGTREDAIRSCAVPCRSGAARRHRREPTAPAGTARSMAVGPSMPASGSTRSKAPAPATRIKPREAVAAFGADAP